MLFDVIVNMRIKNFKVSVPPSKSLFVTIVTQTIQRAAVNLHFMLRVLLVCLTASLALWLRYVVMVTGPPSFHAMDNPAAHANNWITRVIL